MLSSGLGIDGQAYCSKMRQAPLHYKTTKRIAAKHIAVQLMQQGRVTANCDALTCDAPWQCHLRAWRTNECITTATYKVQCWTHNETVTALGLFHHPQDPERQWLLVLKQAIISVYLSQNVMQHWLNNLLSLVSRKHCRQDFHAQNFIFNLYRLKKCLQQQCPFEKAIGLLSSFHLKKKIFLSSSPYEQWSSSTSWWVVRQTDNWFSTPSQSWRLY